MEENTSKQPAHRMHRTDFNNEQTKVILEIVCTCLAEKVPNKDIAMNIVRALQQAPAFQKTGWFIRPGRVELLCWEETFCLIDL